MRSLRQCKNQAKSQARAPTQQRPPLFSSRRLKLKGSMVSNFPLAQHRVAVSANAGLSLCTAHGATEQGKPLPARPRGRISPGETENTKLAGFYSRRLGSTRYSEFLVHSPALLSRKQLINKLFGQQLNSFYLAKRKATYSRDFIKQQPSIFTSPTQKSLVQMIACGSFRKTGIQNLSEMSRKSKSAIS